MQRTNEDYKLIAWEDVNGDVPQGSIFGLLLFNTATNEMLIFLTIYDICN